MKLMVSTMLSVSADMKWQYSSVLPLLCHCLPVFDKICGMAMNFILVKIANTPLDRSAALVLSVINWTYCSCTGICQIRQIWLEIWPEPDLARFLKNCRIPDLPELEPKSCRAPAKIELISFVQHSLLQCQWCMMSWCSTFRHTCC